MIGGFPVPSKNPPDDVKISLPLRSHTFHSFSEGSFVLPIMN
jgi:hypothetical protein